MLKSYKELNLFILKVFFIKNIFKCFKYFLKAITFFTNMS